MMAAPGPKQEKGKSIFGGIFKKKDGGQEDPAAPTPAEAPLELQKEKLNERFEAFMEEKCFKPEAREKMRLMPDQQKIMILAQEEGRSKGAENKEVNDPQHWFKVLTNPKLSESDLHSLEIVLRSQGKSWMQKFHEDGGLSALLSIVANESKPQPTAMLCLKAFMNNGFGLHTILSTPAAIEQITSVLAFGDSKMTSTTLDLLAVLCWVSGKGHSLVLEALGMPRFKHPKYKFLVDMMTHHTHEIKNQVLTLINAIINSTDHLEDRIRIRDLLVSLGLRDAVERLQQIMYAERDPVHADLFGRMGAQVDLFDEESRNDKREVIYNKLDLSDADELFKYVRLRTAQDGYGDYLVRILQYIIAIPSDRTTAVRIWQNLDALIGFATELVPEDQPSAEPPAVQVDVPVITYAQLKEALSSRGGIVIGDNQKSVVNELRAKNAELEDNLTKANERIKQLEKAPPPAARPAPPAPTPAAPAPVAPVAQVAPIAGPDPNPALQAEIKSLNEQIEKLRAELETARSSASAGVPMAPGFGIPGAPPLDGPPMAPPLFGDIPGAPPMAPPFGDVPGAPPMAPPFGDGAPPMAPPFGDIPGAPPMAPAFGDIPGAPPMAPGLPGAPPMPFAPPIVDMGPKLPPKPVIKPRQKMRQLHWAPVDPKQVLNTCWKDLTDDNIKLDIKEFENLFSVAEKKKEDSSKNLVPESKKKEVQPAVELIDSKRAYNINIALARIRMSNDDIRKAILKLDKGALDEEKVSSLLKCAPTPEEAEAVKSYDGDFSALGAAEKFFKVIGDIPRIEKRLSLFLFVIRFDSLLSEVDNMLRVCEQSNTLLKKSRSLKQILEIVLALGNYLNGGTSKGQAYGFKLDTLFKLSATKASDGTTSLLHYLVRMVESKYPDAKKFTEELTILNDSSRVESAVLASEVSKFCGQIRQIGSELKSASGVAGDEFQSVMGAFFTMAEAKGNELQARLDTVQKDGAALIEYFGESVEKKKLEEIYVLFKNFVDEFKGAEEFLNKQKLEQERKDKLEADRSKKQQQQQTLNLGELRSRAVSVNPAAEEGKKDEGGQVDAVMKALQTTDANDIMKQIRERRKKAQDGKAPSIPARRSSGAKSPAPPPAAARPQLPEAKGPGGPPSQPPPPAAPKPVGLKPPAPAPSPAPSPVPVGAPEPAAPSSIKKGGPPSGPPPAMRLSSLGRGGPPLGPPPANR